MKIKIDGMICWALVMLVVNYVAAHDYNVECLESKHNVALHPIPKRALSMDDSLYLLLALHPIQVQNSAIDQH